MPKIPTRPATGPRQRPPFLIGGNLTLALIRQDGEEGEIITAITLLRHDLTKRLERIEKKIGTPTDAGAQATIDRLTAQLKAANDQLVSDVSSSTPPKE